MIPPMLLSLVKFFSSKIRVGKITKMLTEMARLSYQHRAISCYIILSIWIFLLVAGMYKYIGTEEANSMPGRPLGSEIPVREFPRQLKRDIRNQRIFKVCHLPEDITLGSEGKIDGNVTLEGVIIFLRHGDRGPLAHVRNISGVNCASDFGSNPEMDNLLQAYQTFLLNVSIHSRVAWSQFLGPFHNFPMLPENTRECRIGQLTTLGVGQLLKVGSLLRTAYHQKLNLGNGTISSKDAMAYSTPMRRTVQSGIAFLYAFFENETTQNLAKLTFRESQSYVFCNTDCACPAAERYGKAYTKEMNDHLRSHPAVTDLIKQASNVVFEMPENSQKIDANQLRDALLTYICHGGALPCVDSDNQRICTRAEDVAGLFAYNDWERRQGVNSKNLRKYALLRAYGMLRMVVSHMLQIVSESKPKLTLFSAHDRTLEYLAVALGVVSERVMAPPCASRFIIEVYRANSRNDNRVASDFYYRVLFNGHDLTRTIPFCRSANYHAANYADINDDGETTKRETILCPIEAIIRQLHDNYFLPFNATNFKNACADH